MPIPVRNADGRLDMEGLYYLASAVRSTYGSNQFIPFGATPYGPFRGAGRVSFDMNGRKRTVYFPLSDTLVVCTGGLLASDWPWALLSGNFATDVTGIFAGQAMQPAVQLWTWTWQVVLDTLLQLQATPNMIFAGHSFGGALATMFAWKAKQFWPSRNVSVVTFGSPLFADAEFNFECPVPVLRLTNEWDPIPLLPNLNVYHGQGERWEVRRSGISYPPVQPVVFADGSRVTPDQAYLLEKTPRAKRISDGLETTGQADDISMSFTISQYYESHGMDEYVRRIRRFIDASEFGELDKANNIWNAEDGRTWRLPAHKPSPFRPGPLLNCNNGGCPPVGC